MPAPASLADSPTPDTEWKLCGHAGCPLAIRYIKRNREWIHSSFGPVDHLPVVPT